MSRVRLMWMIVHRIRTFYVPSMRKLLLGHAVSVVLSFLACGSSSDSTSGSGPAGSTSQCRAAEARDGQAVVSSGCSCGDDAVASGRPSYPTRCTAAALSGNSICCKSATSCRCAPAQCGTSISGSCACGAFLPLYGAVNACTGTASMCCTQDTGYCYCEDGCDKRFSSHSVGSSCAPSNAPLRCSESAGETEVQGCE
jgi:hypothetical protein